VATWQGQPRFEPSAWNAPSRGEFAASIAAAPGAPFFSDGFDLYPAAGDGCRRNRAEPMGNLGSYFHKEDMHKELPARGAGMDAHARKCLERAAEILRLAEAEEDPELKSYLVNLAASWTRAAGNNIAEPEDV
jgi:hypothetical protein